jgi:hypothetical protein
MTTTPEQTGQGPGPRPAAEDDAAAPGERAVPPAVAAAAEAAVRDRPLPAPGAPRWVRWVVVPLLILVPLVYVLISADQSRDGGAEKEQEAAAKHLTWEVPSQLLRRIYQVPIPDGTVGDAYMETNAWDHSEFYVQFTTNAGGLDTFLAQVGTARTELTAGKVTIPAARASTAGWDFSASRPWAGVSLHQVGDKPDHDITVDLQNPDAPVVYVVSTVNFQHGFGRG